MASAEWMKEIRLSGSGKLMHTALPGSSIAEDCLRARSSTRRTRRAFGSSFVAGFGPSVGVRMKRRLAAFAALILMLGLAAAWLLWPGDRERISVASYEKSPLGMPLNEVEVLLG